MKTNNSVLIIDCQVLQTSSFNRGMGRYSLNLLLALNQNNFFAEYSKVVFLLNRNLNLENALFALNPILKANRLTIDYVSYPHKVASNESIHRHQRVIDQLISNKYSNLNVTTILLSIFELDQAVSVFPSHGIKLLLFYDLIPLLFPAEFLANIHVMNDYFYRFKELFQADQIFSISETSKNDLITYLNIKPEKIINIRGGSISNVTQEVKPKGLSLKPYFLFPSGDNWRKNNELTIKAFNTFNKNEKYSLVITSSFSKQSIENCNVNKNIIFTQHVSDQEMLWLYKNATGVVFPSIYEGLGLPILEAIEVNKPILASNIDVFKEFTDNSFIFCDPKSEKEIANSFKKLLSFSPNVIEYKKIFTMFSWANTADTVKQNAINPISPKLRSHSLKHTKRIALVGPSPNGYSAIGKFCQELLPVFPSDLDVDFYFEMPPGVKDFKKSYVTHVWNSFPVSDLPKNISKYDRVIYNIGNSEFHALTFLLALKYPDTVILHDIDLSGLNNVLKRDITDWQKRVVLEKELEKNYLKSQPASNVFSLINRQRILITHNEYSYARLSKLVYNNSVKLLELSLPIAPPILVNKPNKIPVIAIAGLISPEKNGMQTIKLIETFHTKFKFIIFGYTFHDNAFLELSELSKRGIIELHHNVTDYEFNELLKKSDYLINLRPNYRGEASKTVLESLRCGVIPIVSNVGWFAELPDSIAIKISNDHEILELLNSDSFKNKSYLKDFKSSVKLFLKQINYDVYTKKIIDSY